MKNTMARIDQGWRMVSVTGYFYFDGGGFDVGTAALCDRADILRAVSVVNDRPPKASTWVPNEYNSQTTRGH